MKRWALQERTYGRILEEKARANGSRVFLRYGNQEVSYAEANEQVRRAATGFALAGVSKGSKVALMLPNCPEYIYLWWGLARIGAVEVPINTAHRGDVLVHVLNDCDAELLVVHEEYLPAVASVEDQLQHLRQVYVLEEKGICGREVPRLIPTESAEKLLAAPADPPDVLVRHSDLVSIMYTSGTTGRSKGIMRVHNHDFSIASILAEAGRLTPDDVFHTCLPWFHGIAQYMVTTPALLSDASVAMSREFSAGRFWEEIRAYRATATYMVESIARILYKQPPRPDDADNPLRLCYIVGAPHEMASDFQQRFGVRFIDAFGSTESNVLAVTSLDVEPRPRSAGRIHPAFEVRVVDENDEPLPPGEIGEFVCRSREPYTLMVGYYKRPEETLQAFRNLWYHTGDAGYIDADGYVYFTGRVKDAIRRRGENISAFEVEAIIGQHPAVLECAAVGVPSELGEEEVKVVVVLRPGAQLSPEELLDFCEGKMAHFMIPRFVEFVPELPKTSTGKVEKYRLREQGVSPSTWDRDKAGYELRR